MVFISEELKISLGASDAWVGRDGFLFCCFFISSSSSYFSMTKDVFNHPCHVLQQGCSLAQTPAPIRPDVITAAWHFGTKTNPVPSPAWKLELHLQRTTLAHLDSSVQKSDPYNLHSVAVDWDGQPKFPRCLHWKCPASPHESIVGVSPGGRV